jgi:hypothetical protein
MLRALGALRASLPIAVLPSLVGAAGAHAVTVGDAYATQGANACTWTIGPNDTTGVALNATNVTVAAGDTVEVVRSGQRNSRFSGIAVNVDGFHTLTNPATVVQEGAAAVSFRGPDVAQAAVFQAAFPTAGAHTLTIVIRGAHTLEAGGSGVQVDAFHVRP